jgi:hypothetical protein
MSPIHHLFHIWHVIHDLYLEFVPSFVPILVSSSYDDSEDANPPPPTHFPLVESIEHKLAPVPTFPGWVFLSRETTLDIVDDPRYQRQTRS